MYKFEVVIDVIFFLIKKMYIRIFGALLAHTNWAENSATGRGFGLYAATSAVNCTSR